MAAPIVQVGATLLCAHGGNVQLVPGQTRVLVGGAPAATMSTPTLVAGCPFVVASVPQPCIRGQWIVPATRVMAGGSPVILQNSTGLGLGPTQAPQGPLSVIVAQTRVMGT